MSEIILKIAEISQRHVGKGIALVDPKIIEDNNWEVGQVLEIIGNRKSHVKLWPGSPEDYGTGIIKIDGLTRHNIGTGKNEKVYVKKVNDKEAKKVNLNPNKKLKRKE